MSENKSLVSKVLVLDGGSVNSEVLKAICDEYDLVAIRPLQSGHAGVMALLESNIDLGGIIIFEDYGGARRGIELARLIRDARPELPMFLRRERHASMIGLSDKDAAMFRCAYTFMELSRLRESLDSSIFNRVYPTPLVRGIAEITSATFESLFRNCDIELDVPYLVKDRLIYGEIFTLISIESHWCRGYMMLQASEADLLRVAPLPNGMASSAQAFRELNNVLGEATNMIWGGFKNRYVGSESRPVDSHIQVPIIVNHEHRFISFGSEDPQLCMKYVIRDRNRPDLNPVSIYQRFIFNLNWSPEDMSECPLVESAFESGELEVF